MHLLEPVERDLVAPEGLDAGGDVLTCLPGDGRLLSVGRESLLEVAAFLSAPTAQPGPCSEIVELPGGTCGEGLHGFQPGLRRAQLLDRRGKFLAGVSWLAGEDLLVFGDLLS